MKEEIKEVVSSVVEAAGKVDKGMVDTIMSKLEVMASGLGTTAEYLWGVVIKQAIVTACYDGVLLSAFALIIAGYAIFLRIALRDKFFASRATGGDDDARQIVTIIITGIGAVVVIVFTATLLSRIIPELITCLINPEYWAFEQICNKIK